ncbi:MarR family winged helix-turn-helix transcriptional regulator [Steroidobacter sp.]|uniref:MarR family winged helix-turn-helix transcriptional regulator n=1 Tax=Steroidobacter sp. TaxID=1978227 RepID=UPI0025E208D1|nr:MarR family transcriptional regulator [Steroidobacter sp.]
MASSAAKLSALRGIPADLIELESPDTLAILAFVQIHHSAELIVKAVERNLATHNLSLARYVVLRLLVGRDPVPLGWIAEKHFSRMSNITGVIDRLVRDGLVERLPDPDDRRIVRVKLTPAGDKLLRATRRPHREFLAKTMSPLADDDLRTLVVLLSKLTEPLEAAT